MPRIRSIKPDFFTSEDVSALPLRARLTWIGLWTHCDDHGRTKDVVRLIKAALWPLDDVSLADVEQDLAVLAEEGRIVRYEVEGRTFLAVVNWHVHQAINRPGKPRHPAPPVPVGPTSPKDEHYCPECVPSPTGSVREDAVSPHGALTPGKEGKGKEGTRAGSPAGGLTDSDAPPPLRCPKHLDDPEPGPCGGCGDARRAHDTWQQRRRDRPTLTPTAPPCPIEGHGQHPATTCPACARAAVPAPNLRDQIRALRDETRETA